MPRYSQTPLENKAILRKGKFTVRTPPTFHNSGPKSSEGIILFTFYYPVLKDIGRPISPSVVRFEMEKKTFVILELWPFGKDSF